MTVTKTPPRSPNCNPHAERFTRSVREECTNRVLIFDRGHAKKILQELKHYESTRDSHLRKPRNRSTNRCSSLPLSAVQRGSTPYNPPIFLPLPPAPPIQTPTPGETGDTASGAATCPHPALTHRWRTLDLLAHVLQQHTPKPTRWIRAKPVKGAEPEIAVAAVSVCGGKLCGSAGSKSRNRSGG
ncbi:hypothetical protein ACWDKQ_35655 [Saccharopolyspora sp. NPDC000995]